MTKERARMEGNLTKKKSQMPGGQPGGGMGTLGIDSYINWTLHLHRKKWCNVSPTVVVESSDSKTLSERKKLVFWKKIDSGRV